LPAGLPEDFTIPGPPPDISQLQTPIVSGQSQPVTFRSGQAVVTPAAAAALKALVAARAGKMIRVIGRGEAASYDPAVQARALQLGLARADAIAAVLRGAGLPPSAMRVTVEPFGRGGAALLIS
jgi:outer membrane protein OmpA-like peptidoglycan-associated protein